VVWCVVGGVPHHGALVIHRKSQMGNILVVAERPLLETGSRIQLATIAADGSTGDAALFH